MASPSLLFVYQWVAVGSSTHAKCICCSSDLAISVGYWPEADVLSGFVLPNGPNLQLSHKLCSEMPFRCPDGAEDLYADEPFLKSQTGKSLGDLSVMQNKTFAVIAGHTFHIPLPFFVTTDFPTTPSIRTVIVRLCIHGVADLPEAQLFRAENERALRGADNMDKLMYAREESAENVATPVDAYLPCTIESAGIEYPVVYRIDKYVGSNVALMTLNLSDRTTPIGPGTVLRRRCRAPGFRDRLTDVAIVEEVKGDRSISQVEDIKGVGTL